MAITLTSLGGATGTSSSQVTIGAGGVPSAALIVVLAQDNGTSGTTTGTVADTAGNTYTQVAHVTPNNNTATFGPMAVFYAHNVTALVNTNTITFTAQTAGHATSIVALYATGIATSSPLDTNATPTFGNSASPSITSSSPAVAGELFVAAIAWNSAGGITLTQPGSWNTPPITEQNSTSTVALGGGTIVNAGSGAETYAPTLSSSTPWGAILLSFKPLAAAANVYGFTMPFPT